MIGWLAAKSLLGAPRWLLAVAVLAFAVWAGAALIGALNHHEAAQRAAGKSEARAEDLGETLKRTEQGNEARDEVRKPGSSAKYDQCLRAARNPEVCERFLPQ